MQLVELPAKKFAGLKTRATNDPNAGAVGQSIQDLWTQFWNDHHTIVKGMVYGVYSNYESDHTGAYDVHAAIEVDGDLPDGLHTISAPGGRYLRFHSEGTMPKVVQDTWQQIWDYFDDDQAPFERAFNVDFEEYPSDKEVTIYISIK